MLQHTLTDTPYDYNQNKQTNQQPNKQTNKQQQTNNNNCFQLHVPSSTDFLGLTGHSSEISDGRLLLSDKESSETEQ